MLFIGQRKAILGRRSLAQQVAALFAASEQGAWYDPSDLTSMSQTSGGTVGNVAVGDPVGKILDKSGRGNHATQGTSASRPILRQAGALYYLEFDGFDDYMVTSAINFSTTDKMTVWAGLLATSTGMTVELGINDGINGSFSEFANTTYHDGRFSSGATRKIYGFDHAALPVTNVTSFHLTRNAAPYIAGRVNAVVTTKTTVLDEAITGNFSNDVLYIFRRGGITLPLQGRMYGLIVRGATSTAAQISTGEKYLNGKTGVTL